MPLLAITAEKCLSALAMALSAWGRDEGEERLVVLLPCHVCLRVSRLFLLPGVVGWYLP